MTMTTIMTMEMSDDDDDENDDGAVPEMAPRWAAQEDHLELIGDEKLHFQRPQ